MNSIPIWNNPGPVRPLEARGDLAGYTKVAFPGPKGIGRIIGASCHPDCYHAYHASVPAEGESCRGLKLFSTRSCFMTYRFYGLFPLAMCLAACLSSPFHADVKPHALVS